jgi:alpha-glucosidase (family GH31 glycosyl hydrolase)
MRWGAAAVVAAAVWLAGAGSASARTTVSIGSGSIVVRGPGARLTATRQPFRLSFADGSGRRVLSEVSAPPSQAGLQLTLPGVIGTPPAASTQTLFAPLTFTVGSQQLSAYSSGFWEGNLTGVTTAGTQYAAERVLSVRAVPDGVAAVVSTSDPTGRVLNLRLTVRGGRVEVEASPSPAGGVATVGDSFVSGPDEAFRGFGGRHNALDQHGNSFYSWAEEENVDAGPFQSGAGSIPGSSGANYLFPNGPTAAYYPQPLFISSRRYGFLIDQPDFARFNLDSSRPDAWQTDTGTSSLRYVVAPGSAPHAIAELTAISGRQRVPPRWGLGPMLDRLVGSGGDAFFGRVGQDIANIDHYRLPLTAYRVEGWDTITEAQDRQLFAELHARHIHPLVYFRAYVGKHANTTHGGEMLDYATQHGYVATTAARAPYTFGDPEEGVGAVIDFTNPAARAWWASRIDAALDLGADGFMQDFGEQVMPDMHFADGETGESMHNRYPVLYHQATRQALDAYAKRHPGRSFFFFTRAGYTGRPGSAAYENANFPGDETTDWTHSSGLASIVPDMLNRAVGGAYGYGTDIGGYTDITTPATTKELFLRWAEAAALTPVFRLHGSVEAGTHTPWSYDAQTLRTYIHLSRLHLAAAPLILRLWRTAQRTGIPPTRPLWLAYPGAAAAAAQDEEWLLGADVLVAPVVTQGATTRRVYVPRGCWRSPATGRRYRGPGYRNVAAPLTSLPYFFRCGRRPFAPPPR